MGNEGFDSINKERLEAAEQLRSYQLRSQVPPQRTDDLDVTPAEASEMLQAMTQLTIALSAFIVVAEKLYPRLKNGPLASRAAKLREIVELAAKQPDH